MIACLSPAKNLDFETPIDVERTTTPRYLEESQRLIERLREVPRAKVKSLMSLSDKLTDLNVERYRKWDLASRKGNARPCFLAFNGDVYRGLDAYSLSQDDLDFAQDHVRILSGLHGLLRPLDLVQPYRLEMGTRLEVDGAANLYEFWGDKITRALAEALEGQKNPVLVNLASQEYFKAVDPEELPGPVIQPVFKDWKNGKYSVFFVYAKKARGMMARYMVENRLDQPEDLKSFDVDGYRYNKELSEDDQWVFTRKNA